MRKLTVVAVMATLAMAATASAGRDLGHKIGSASARGDYATAVASGTANHPKKILARVTARPHQRVNGSYTVVCSKGFGAGSKDGSLNGNAPLTKKLALPMRKPDSCTVGASAQLDDGGKVKVKLFAK